MTHTPGPWEVMPISTEDRTRVILKGGTNWLVAETGNRTTAVADAHLIAAAPDLLKSLRELVDTWESADEEPSCITRARAAIAKAEERS